MALLTMAAATAATRLKPRTSPPLLAAMSRILHLDPSSGVRRFGTPSHGRNLEQNNVNSNGAPDDDNLMLEVKWGKNNLSLLSIENNSLQLFQPSRPNLSRPNSSAVYEFLAGCDKWVVLGSEDKDITTPADLLWDLKTDEVRPIPRFQMKPHLPIADTWYTYCGVGFDSGSGDYKVLRCFIREYVGNEPSEVRGELLSIGTGSWREIRLPRNHEDLSICSSYCNHINGFYYWHALLLSECPACDVIVPFDFRREEFSADLIPMPDLCWCSEIVLAEYHGSLAVIFHTEVNDRPHVPFRFEIWVWSERGRTWSRLSTVNVPANAGVTEVVGIYKSEKVILVDSQGAFLLYDCGTTELENFDVLSDYKDAGFVVSPHWFQVSPHYSKSKRT